MQFGLDVPTTKEYADPRALAKLAADAEQAGWDGFFIWDVVDGIDPWIALAAIALQTTRIKLGLMVLALPRHQPWVTAKRLADLDQLSGGRVICTVGLGHREEDFTAVGATSDPVIRAQQLDQGLTIMEGIWTQPSFSYSSAHYTLHNLAMVKPRQLPRIPLWVAGGWPRTAPFRRAALWDGIVFKSIHHETRQWLTIDDFRAGVAYVQAQRRTVGPFEIAMSGDSSGDRQAAVEKVAAFGQAGATWWVEEGLGWSLEEFTAHVNSGPPRQMR